jgi:hypothetical protein
MNEFISNENPRARPTHAILTLALTGAASDRLGSRESSAIDSAGRETSTAAIIFDRWHDQFYVDVEITNHTHLSSSD